MLPACAESDQSFSQLTVTELVYSAFLSVANLEQACVSYFEIISTVMTHD